MSFLSLLKSLDELLFEVISWLIFWPLTLWRIVRHPRQMMRYAGAELHDAPDQQYQDTLRPPLFLLITILIGHAIELALIGESAIVMDKVGLAGLIDDDTNLVLLRLALFGSLPLILATRLLRRQHTPITRDALKPHFYSQCYAVAPFALVLGLAFDASQLHWWWAPIAYLTLLAAALLWYGLLQLDWFRHHLRVGRGRALWDASVAMVECVAMIVIVGALVG